MLLRRKFLQVIIKIAECFDSSLSSEVQLVPNSSPFKSLRNSHRKAGYETSVLGSLCTAKNLDITSLSKSLCVTSVLKCNSAQWSLDLRSRNNSPSQDPIHLASNSYRADSNRKGKPVSQYQRNLRVPAPNSNRCVAKQPFVFALTDLIEVSSDIVKVTIQTTSLSKM